MSSVMVINRDDAVHVYTDGAVYNEHGVVIDFENKVRRLPKGVGLIWGRGNWYHFNAMHLYIEHVGLGFDDLVKELADIANYAHGNEKLNIDTRSSEIGLAGWSESRSKLEYHIWSSHVNLGGREAGKLHEYTSHLIFTPPAEETYLRAIGWKPRHPDTPMFDHTLSVVLGNAFDPKADGLKLMEAQRRYLMKEGDTEVEDGTYGGAYLVGGHALLSTITQHGITDHLLRRWPDKLGWKITPALVEVQRSA